MRISLLRRAENSNGCPVEPPGTKPRSALTGVASRPEEPGQNLAGAERTHRFSSACSLGPAAQGIHPGCH